MTMKHQELFTEDIQLILEAGFIAINQADEDSARKLFRAAELIEPENALVHIGSGYLAMHKLDVVNAQKGFQKALEIEPENQMARAFLGLSYMFVPDGVIKGEKMCMNAIKHTHDKLVKNFAESALEFSDTFIKNQGKKQSPMGLHKKPAHKPKKK